MSRVHLFEIEDQSWCPSAVRSAMTDYLAFVGNLSSKPYEAFAARLAAVMKSHEVDQLIDLGAGGGGPTPTLLKELSSHGLHARALLTDLHPDPERLTWLTEQYPNIDFMREPVDATQVPRELEGARIMLNAFHHLDPALAKGVLSDAYQQRRVVSVFEAVERSPAAIFSMLFVPLMVFLFTPFIRPFSISRLFFTYVIPLVPLFALFDGIVSCLRIYSPLELQGLVEGMDEDYTWETGYFALPGPGRVTYLIGYPGPSLPE